MYCGEEVKAVVADIGTSNARFGYAGQDVPKACFSSSIGFLERPIKASEGGEQTNPSPWVISDSELSVRRDDMVVRQSMKDAVVHDEEAFAQLWDRAFAQLHIDRDHAVMFSEATWSTNKQRERLMELLFETHGTPALYVAHAPTLSAFSAGRSTSLVVDISASGIAVTPVVEGYSLIRSARRSTRGGMWLSDQISGALAAQGQEITPLYCLLRSRDASGQLSVARRTFKHTPPSFHEWAVRGVADDLKASMCGMPLWPMNDDDLAQHLPLPSQPESYELPDGTIIPSSPQLYRIPERLLNDLPQTSTPSTNPDFPKNFFHLGLPSLVRESIMACDVDVRRDMLSNILVCGAGAQFPFLPERLQREVSQRFPPALKIKVVAPENIERRYSSWIGGSILSSLGSFQQLWLSKAEYEEYGVLLSNERLMH